MRGAAGGLAKASLNRAPFDCVGMCRRATGSALQAGGRRFEPVTAHLASALCARRKMSTPPKAAWTKREEKCLAS